jgi:hypothetical protein
MKNDLAELPLYVVRKVDNYYVVYAYSHSSMSNGYVRKNAKYTPISYKGRFGVGFTVLTNNSTSTRNCYKTYYIEVKHSVVCAANDNCTECPLYDSDDLFEDCHYYEERGC